MSRHLEHDLQRACAKFLHHALPVEAWFTSIDHATVSAQEGQIKKARGVKRGLPDMLVLWSGRTIWIELKATSGLTDDQQRIRDILLANGHAWHLARSVAELEGILCAHLIPLRATTMSAARSDELLALRAERPPVSSAPRVEKPSQARIRRANAIRQRIMF